MTFLKPGTLFPSKIPPGPWWSEGYEIRRSIQLYPEFSTGVSWSVCPPHVSLEAAEAYCDRMNVLEGACVVLRIRADVLGDLIQCTVGESTWTVFSRRTKQLILRTQEEVDATYVIVSSDKFRSRRRACRNAGLRIAEELRRYIKTVK